MTRSSTPPADDQSHRTSGADATSSSTPRPSSSSAASIPISASPNGTKITSHKGQVLVDPSPEARASMLSARKIDDPGIPELAETDPTVFAAQGLSSEQVDARRNIGLTNAQPSGTTRSLGTILRTHILTLFNLVIGLCALGIILLGRWLDLLFSLAALANIIIGVVQEYSAKRKLDRIALLNQDDITVVRHGERVEVNLNDVVLDDVVLLRTGDQVPADGVLLSGSSLEVDESLLTGESDPVPKIARGRGDADTLLSGTSVVAGSGMFRVTGVGYDSHAAQLTIKARQFTKVNSELRAGLEKVATWITIVLIPLIFITAFGQIMALGRWPQVTDETTLSHATVATIAGITTMIPQGLALMTTISFALAALNLARQDVLIQEQPAVEILARVDTVCLDKTGTLTEGGALFNGIYSTDDDGPDPQLLDHRAPSSSTDEAWAHVLATVGADPNANSTASALAPEFPVSRPESPTDAVPFASERRWSAFGFGTPAQADGDSLAGAWYLGAPEALIHALQIPETHRDLLSARAKNLARQGLRVMMLARGSRPVPGATADQPWFGATMQLASDLMPVVFVTFRENVRDDAHETLEYFREQGVQLKIISGDSPHTVAAVAHEVGWNTNDETGTVEAFDARELPEDDLELREVMSTYSVFGRVAPEQKKRMVEALQADDHVVAMTGDGINDALALKSADLGIAMGNGAPATKAVSRMVLLDSKFSRLPSVLSEGRKVIANMERLAHLYLSKTAYAFLFVLLFSLILWQYPLLPRQTSTADALFIGMASFVLALMPNPRRYVPGFLKRSLRFAIPAGIALVIGLLAINFVSRIYAGDFSGVLPFAEDPSANLSPLSAWDGSPDAATAAGYTLSMEQLQTATYITLVISGLWLLNVISRPLNWQKVLVLSVMYVAFVLTLIVPISQWYHRFILPPTEILLWSVGIGLAACVLLEIIYRAHNGWLRKNQPEALPAG